MSGKLARIVAALIVIAICQSLHAANEDLKKFCDFIEVQCKKNEIPGLAIVIVDCDEVLLSEVFGFTDLDKKNPITRDTIFPIGSSTKPFTSTLIAMLVSDGTMSWDDPVTKYLPEFDLKIKSDSTSDRVTIRDLLSHRTGFFHMQLIQTAVNWGQAADFSPPHTRDSLLRAAAEFEPKDSFRKRHNYSNVSMLAAALASGRACNTDWDTLMAQRMFKPLGMKRSSTSIRQIDEHDAALAVGHLKGEQGIEKARLINLDVISPAGGVNSTLADMTKWLQLLLGEGRFEDQRLVTKEALQETWTSQITGADLGGMLPGADYGLGWFVKKWKGYRYVEHGGNALGFSANVALIPDLRVGYVMLSNVLPNPLQVTLSERVWEVMVSDR